MIVSYERGHETYWDVAGEVWRYLDNDDLCEEWGGVARSCPGCGEMPTPEGFDACLGMIEGMSSVCCGHGVHEPYSVLATENVVEIPTDSTPCAHGCDTEDAVQPAIA